MQEKTFTIEQYSFECFVNCPTGTGISTDNSALPGLWREPRLRTAQVLPVETGQEYNGWTVEPVECEQG